MPSWLLIAAAAQAALDAGADMKSLAPIEIGHVAADRVLDFRLVDRGIVAGPIPLIRGMIVQRGIGSNAAIGVGLANLYSRRKLGFDASSDGRPKRSRKPAVTFMLKF